MLKCTVTTLPLAKPSTVRGPETERYEACQRRQPILLLLRTKMYEIASGCKKSVGVE